MGNWANWCCRGSCAIASDDFNRADSTDLGSLWQEVSGDWTIASNRLREAGTSGTLVVCTTQNPSNTPTCHAGVLTKDLQEGKKFRLLVNLTEDFSRYLYAEFTCLAGTSAWASIGDETGEIAGRDANYTPGQDSSIGICRNLTGMYATFGVARPYIHACVSWNGGRRAGLGNGSSEIIQFDDFDFRQHQVSTDDPACPGCLCDCEDYAVCRNLVATFETEPGEAPWLDGQEISLGPGLAPLSSTIIEWSGEKDLPSCGGPDYTVHWELALDCVDWVLCRPSGCGNDWTEYCDVPAGPAKSPSLIQCDPLLLRYGPFGVILLGGGSYQFWINITNGFP